MLPLGVLIPTKDSMPYLPRHIEALRAWADLASEIVVVDSHSRDGSAEFVAGELKHPNLRLYKHPPGLYASWNYGVQQVRSEFVYIATAGDTITRSGIEQLHGAAVELGADVVISKPSFVDLNGQAADEPFWPVDDIIKCLEAEKPVLLSRPEATLFAAANPEAALLGSCASDLFRTALLQRLPFPTNAGTAGDGAWGWQHAAEARLAAVPGRFSTFLKHPSNISPEEKARTNPAPRADTLLRAAIPRWQENRVINDRELALLQADRLLHALTTYLDAKSKFDRQRRARIPWILSPAACGTRMTRQRARRELTRLKDEILAALKSSEAQC